MQQEATTGMRSRVWPSRAAVPTMRERLRWARSIDKLVEDAKRRPSLYRQFRPIVRPEMTRAVEPDMLAIAGALRDERQPVSRAALSELREFMTDGATSPLFGVHLTRAAFVAARLRDGFTAQQVRGDGERAPVATR